MSEKPLHVQVAEALGMICHNAGPAHPAAGGGDWWIAEPMRTIAAGETWSPTIPRYDTDWSATGPLIERYHIRLCNGLRFGDAAMYGEGEPKGPKVWWAETSFDGWGDPYPWTILDERERDATIEALQADSPLRAVCNLILALHAAGKLPK